MGRKNLSRQSPLDCSLQSQMSPPPDEAMMGKFITVDMDHKEEDDSNEIYQNFKTKEVSVLNAIFKDLASRTKYTTTMDKSSFLKFFNFPSLMGERLFAVFDKNHDGEIDWEEFIDGIRLYLNGDIREKIRLLFKMYDLGDDEYISKKELSMMLRSLTTPATSFIHEPILSFSMSPKNSVI